MQNCSYKVEGPITAGSATTPVLKNETLTAQEGAPLQESLSTKDISAAPGEYKVSSPTGGMIKGADNVGIRVSTPSVAPQGFTLSDGAAQEVIITLSYTPPTGTVRVKLNTSDTGTVEVRDIVIKGASFTSVKKTLKGKNGTTIDFDDVPVGKDYNLSFSGVTIGLPSYDKTITPNPFEVKDNEITEVTINLISSAVNEYTVTSTFETEGTPVELADPATQKVKEGETFTCTAKDIAGYKIIKAVDYQGREVADPSTITGTMPGEDITCWFFYKKTTSNVKVVLETTLAGPFEVKDIVLKKNDGSYTTSKQTLKGADGDSIEFENIPGGTYNLTYASFSPDPDKYNVTVDPSNTVVVSINSDCTTVKIKVEKKDKPCSEGDIVVQYVDHFVPGQREENYSKPCYDSWCYDSTGGYGYDLISQPQAEHSANLIISNDACKLDKPITARVTYTYSIEGGGGTSPWRDEVQGVGISSGSINCFSDPYNWQSRGSFAIYSHKSIEGVSGGVSIVYKLGTLDMEGTTYSFNETDPVGTLDMFYTKLVNSSPSTYSCCHPTCTGQYLPGEAWLDGATIEFEYDGTLPIKYEKENSLF